MFKVRYALMDEAGGDGGAASGGGTTGGDAGATGAAGAAGSAGTGSTATGTTGTGDSGTGASGTPATSALAAGAGAAPTTDFIPEKYRVTKDDGTVDIDASARKLAEAHGSLEKRLGTGDAPPKTSAEYQVAVPEALKEAFPDLSTDKGFTDFRDQMHGLGLTQKQFDGVMAKYFEVVPSLVAGGSQVSSEEVTATLKQAWPTEKAFKDNVALSYRAADAIAKAAGLNYDDVEKAGLGNNATFIKLMAAIGPEFGEATQVNGESSSTMSNEAQIKELMMSEANTNTKHPQHAATRAKITAFYDRKYGTAPIA
jgi:hypothetical protein